MATKFVKLITAKYFVAGVVTLTMLLVLAALSMPAQAQTFSVLHTFGPWGVSGEGISPSQGLIRDKAGNLYGTTDWGGDLTCNAPNGCGTVFMLDTAGNVTVLHSFSGSPDLTGSQVRVGVRDAAGNFYGTTLFGGDFNLGTVFKLDPLGNYTVLHSFSATPDGALPYAGVIRDSAGNLYGTTIDGGARACNGALLGCGTIFKVDAKGKETVLYRFRGGQDGWYPTSQLTRDEAGNLYGSANMGGAYNFGTLFKLDKAGKESTLYSFNGVDGGYPYAPLIPCGTGVMCSTLGYGFGGPDLYGQVFKLDQKTRTKTVLYTFTGGTDGGFPSSGVIRDSAGNLYGAAAIGGQFGQGVIYKLDPTGKETVLYNFTGGTDTYGVGSSDLLRDSAGNFYGALGRGGDLTCDPPVGCGSLFQFTPQP